MAVHTSGVETSGAKRQRQDLRLEALARAVIWGADDDSIRRLARAITRGGMEATGICADVDTARDAAARTDADLVIATADAVDQWLRRGGARGQPRPGLALPLLIVGFPTGAGSRELLRETDIDFAARYPTVLELRIRAARLLRHIKPDGLERSLDRSGGARQFRYGGTAVGLTDAEFAIMRALTRSPGSIVSSAQLLDELRRRGSRCGAQTNILPVYIGYIKRKLAAFKGAVELRTHRRRGYSVQFGRR